MRDEMSMQRLGRRVAGLAALAAWLGASRPACSEELTADAPRRPLAEAAPTIADVAPVSREDLEAAIDRSIVFLLETQRSDGSWGSADNTKGGVDIYAPAPGAHHAFRCAVTAL